MSAIERDRLRIEAQTLKSKAQRLRAFGNADDRWNAVCLLRDAAWTEIAALGDLDDQEADEAARTRVDACELFLLAKDPLRAMAQWARLPREAFSCDGGAAPADAVKALYGAAVSELTRAWREVLGTNSPPSPAALRADQLRALLDAFPGMAELWWGLSQCSVSPGEAEMARTRALRLDPSMSADITAQAAWDSVGPALLSALRIELQSERRGERPGLEAVSRAAAAFAELLSSFAEKTTDARIELAPVSGLACPGAFALEAIAEGLYPFVLEELDRELGAEGGRVDARATLRLLSILHAHHMKLAVTAASSPYQPALVIHEGRRKALMREAEAAACRSLDSRDIPQADDIDRVFRAVESIVKGAGEPADLTPRQSSYYRRAAKMLGLLTESDEPTPGGRMIARLDSEGRFRAAVVKFESSACGDAWIRWSGGATLLDVDPATAANFLRASSPGLSRDTAERRAQTLISWHRALIGHHYSKGAGRP